MLRAWLSRTRSEYDQVQREASTETLRRFRWIVPLVLAIDLSLVWFYWRNAADLERPAEVARALEQGWSNLVMVALGLLLAFAAGLVLRRGKGGTAAIALQVVLCAVYLGFGAAVSLIDQRVTPSIITFLTVCMAVAVLSLMRPAISMPIYAAVVALFFGLLGYVQPDPLQLVTNRIQTVVAVTLSALVCWVIWHQYVQAVVLRRQLTRSHDALTLKQTELEFLADHDPLTGLYNRREFMRQAELEISRTRRYPAATHVVLADLDLFKQVNDQHGHPVGDAVLRHTAQLLARGVRKTDLVARLGGEEFILLLPQTTQADALAVAEKLRQMLSAEPVLLGSLSVPVAASFGVSGVAAGQAISIEALYKAADAALYQAKLLGRNRVAYSAPASAP